jgi:hypothetical protein
MVAMVKFRRKGARSLGTSTERDRFPPDRAFVVQLSAAERASKPKSGRVEHVLSGRRTRFDTLDSLSEFFGEVLASESGRDAAEED